MTNSEPLSCPIGSDQCPCLGEIGRLNEAVALLTGQVATDPLTGLYNRRHMRAALETEIERTRRSRQATSLVMLDIDHFKRINDGYGHLAGDEVLRQTSRILLQTLRKIDIACRYGGEEFAIILPATPLLVAAEVAERLRLALESATINLADTTQLSITASFGVATYLAEHNASEDALIAQTDGQLYLAKTTGRNCVRYEPAPFRTGANLTEHERAALMPDA